MTKGLDKIGTDLDIASLTQGCKDLWDNRRTNNAYKVINMLAQVIASGSIFLKGSSGMANVLAATAAYHDIRNDYEKKLRLLEHAYLQDMQKESQTNPQTPSSIPYLSAEMKQTLDLEAAENAQAAQAASQGRGRSLG